MPPTVHKGNTPGWLQNWNAHSRVKGTLERNVNHGVVLSTLSAIPTPELRANRNNDMHRKVAKTT